MPVVRRDAEYAAQFETLRATDRDRLRRQPDAQTMRGAAFDVDRPVVQPGGAQYSVRDAVGRELGPAFTPQVLRDLRAIHCAEDGSQLSHALGDASVDFTDAEYGVAVAARPLVAADVSGLETGEAGRTQTARHRPSPSGNPRDARLLDS